MRLPLLDQIRRRDWFNLEVFNRLHPEEEAQKSIQEPRGLEGLVPAKLLHDSLDGPEFPALFSLNMLLGTGGGQSYSGAQVREMLEGAGLVDVRRLDFAGPNHSGIVAGVKPKT